MTNQRSAESAARAMKNTTTTGPSSRAERRARNDIRGGGAGGLRDAANAVVEQLEYRRMLSGVLALPATTLYGPEEPTPVEAQPDHDAPVVITIDWNGQKVQAVEDEYVLKLNNVKGKKSDQVKDIRTKVGKVRKDVSVRKHLNGDGMVVVRGPKGVGFDELKKSLKNTPGFSYIEPNFVLNASSTFPNDGSFSSLYGLHNTGQSGGKVDADIDAPEAWDLARGDGSVVVGVIDTGIDYNHPDLSSNMWRNPGEVAGNSLDDDGNGYVDDVYGWDFVNTGDNDPMDDHYHGTHVAGTIGGVGNNGTGVVGVNWNVKLMALKFLSASGGGNTADAIEAVNYATMMHNLWVSSGGTKGANIRLTSNSWGGGAFSQALMDAIAAAGTSSGGGMLFVAAAGNEGTNNDTTPHYPSSYNLPNIISVAATDRNDAIASFSCYGPTSVDIGAPGVDTYSTSPGNTYRTLSGTSMATPHVSGVAALAWSVSPSATYQQVREAIYAGGDPIVSLSGKTVTGKRLNAFGALQQLGMMVSGSTPAANSIVSSSPLDFVVHFSNAYNPSSVQAGDLLVNGVPADSFVLTDADTVTFHYGSSPVTAQGVQTMTMAAGSVLRQSDGNALAPWSSTFRFDATPMAVTSTNPAPGALVSLPIPGIELNFNEPYAAGSINVADLTLSQGTVTGVTLVDADTVRYLVSGMSGEATVTYTLGAGAVTDQFGNPGLAYSGNFATDIGTVPYPTPLEAKKPRGSLIYDPVASGTIGNAADTDSFTIALDAGQTASLLVDPASGLRPMVELLGPGGASLGSASAAAAGADLLLNSVAAAAAGTYTIRVSSLDGTSGAYTVRLIVNAAIEAEEYGGPTNDTRATAQDLGPSFISLGVAGAARGAVTGKLPSTSGTVPVVSDNFETGSLGAAWSTYNSSAGGRIQVSGANGTGGGAYAMLMDNSTDDGAYRLNEAVWTVDLSGVSAATLSFAHAAFADENEAMPTGDYNGHVNGDGVSISADGVRWRAIWSADSTSWTTPHSFNLAALASAAGMTLGANFKIKFQQYDNFALTTDGRGWDNILISAPAPSQNPNDFYSFQMAAGESATVALSHLTGATGETITLLDSAGNVLTSGVSGSSDVNQSIADFVAPAGGTYYVRVNGPDVAEYNLLVTCNATFDLGGNSTRANAQVAGPSGVVLGALQAQTGSGRLYTYDATALQIREVNPQTGAVIRSFASPAPNTGDPDFGMATTGNSLLVGGSSGSAIYELNLDTGATIRTIPNPGINISGMAFLNNEIYVLTDYIAGQITVFNYTTGAVARTINAPSVIEGLGASATTLYGSNGSSLYRIDPVAGGSTLLGTLATASTAEGLGVLGNELFVSEYDQIGVYDVNTRVRLRSLTGLTNLEAIGADGGGLVNSDDFYRINVNAGQTLVLQTYTPGDGPYEPGNSLDPRLRLLDSAGNLVASDDNSAGDGRNAKISQVVVASGTYYVQVSSTAAAATSGEYVLTITGNSATPGAFSVSATNPASGSSLLSAPTQITVDFSDAVLLSSLQASDLVFDGSPLSAMSIVNGNTATFSLPAGLGQGAHTFTFAAGSVTDIHGNPLGAFNGTFSIDNLPPRVIGSSVQQGDVLAPGNLTYTATFSKQMLVSNLDSSDVTLRGNLRAISYTPTTVSFSADGRTLTATYTNLPEDSYTLTLLSGAGRFESSTGLDLDGEATAWPIPPNQSGNGVEGGNFVATFSSDVTTSAYPVPMVAKGPQGSLIYDPAATGVIGVAGDTDTFTLNLDAGQTLTIFADPSAGLQPTITLRDPSGTVIGTASATGTNLDALLQSVAINTAGTHQITVAGVGSTTGLYTLQAVLNAAVEAEAHNGATNNTPATAQNIDGSFIDLTGGAQRGAVVGTAVSEDEYYSFTLAAGQSATLVLTATASGALELYNSGGILLAKGDAASQAIRDFRAPSAGLYYAKVRGTDHALLVTRGASFDQEPNGTSAQASPLVPGGVALGYLERALSGVEPDNYAVGTVLTNVVPGVTLTVQGSANAVTSQTATYHSTGTRVFANGTTNYFNSSSTWLRADFAVPTASVSIDLVPNDSSDPGIMRAYSSSGVLLQEIIVPSPALGSFATMTITRPSADIAYILAAGQDGNTAHLDNLVVGGGGSGSDSYAVNVNAGDSLVIKTLTPGGGPGEFVNLLDPMVELYDPSGNKVAFDDNGGADGRNPLLNYTAAVAGNYIVKIISGGATATSGEYVLSVSGATGSTTPPFAVSSTSIANGATLTLPPTEITVDFNDTLLLSSLQASDLTVDGIAATGFTVVDFNTVTFALPALGNGQHAVAIAGGAISDLQQTGVSAFSSSFTLDFNPPKIVASSIQEGDVRATGSLTYTVGFSKPMLKTNLDATDVTLLGALKNVSYSPTSFSYDAAGTTLTLTYTNLPEDVYTLTLLSGNGRFEDANGFDLDGEATAWPIPPNSSGNGVAGGNFVLHFSTDAAGVFPTFSPKLPAGSLIYDASVSGVIGVAGDTDSYTVTLDAGQVITFVADAGATLSPSLELRGPGNVLIGSANSTGAGKDAVLQTAPVAVGGTYTIIVGGIGGSTGTYTVSATLNASVEAENNDGATNNARASAQSIDGSFIALGGNSTRGGATGKLDATSGGDFYSFTANADTELFIGFKMLGATQNVAVTLQDAAGNVLAAASAGPINFDKVISGFTVPAAGTYYVVVGGAATPGGDYSLVVNRNAAFDQENNSALATAQNLGNRHAVLGSLSGGGATVGGAIRMGLIQDGVPWGKTANTTVAQGLGYTVTLIPASTLNSVDFSQFDMVVLAGDQTSTVYSSVQSNLARIESWVSTGGVWIVNYAASSVTTPYSYDVLPDANGVTFTGVTGAAIDVLAPSSGLINGPGGTITNTTLDGGTSSYHGYTTSVLPAGATAILSTGTATQVVAFDYGYGLGRVIVDTIPVEYYGGTGNFGNFHKNLFNFGATSSARDSDYYNITLAAGESIRISTATPADGAGEYVNLLDPTLELYAPGGTTPLATNANGAPDGRNAVLTYTATTGGTYKVRVYSSAASAAARGDYVLSLNRTPGAANDEATTLEDTAVTVNVLANDLEGDGDLLTVQSATQPGHGAVVINPDGTITYTPAADYFGPDSFTYTIDDGNGAMSTATVNLTVTPVNDAPSFTAGGSQTVDEDAGAQSISNWATGISAGPGELAQAVDFIVTNDNNALFAQQPTILADGTLSFTPAANINGTATITVRIHDDGGTASGGVDTSAAQTFQITINAVADAPTLSVNPATGDEGAVIPLDIASALVDIDGSESLSIAISGLPAGATLSAGTENAAVWTLTAAQLNGLTIQNLLDNGSFGLSVSATATEASNGNTATTSLTLPLTVNNVKPVVAPLVVPTNIVRGQAVVFSSSFTDAGAADTHEVSWDFGDGSGIAFHPSTDSGALTPQKTYAAAGTYTVTLTIRDDDGGVSSTQKVVTVKVSDVQDDPFNPGKTVLVVGGTAGNDVIHIVQNSKGYRVDFNNVAGTAYKGISRIVLYGQAGDDALSVTRSIDLPIEIYGGAGNDTLLGGGGSDILVGGDGADLLDAASGRDILIGGAGADRLLGGPDDDLQVPSATAHEANRQALVAIQAEWTGGNTYAQRTANILSGGGANGAFQFNSATVIEDNARDTSSGDSGRDWFFARRIGGNADVLTDRLSDELITDLL